MGLFSSKKVIEVSSSVYNLAGDVTKRPNFLKTTVMGQIVDSSYEDDFTAGLQSAYIGGPGVRLRNYPDWANRSGYSKLIGFTTGNLHIDDSINSIELANQIPVSSGYTNEIQRSFISTPDYSYWVEQWILANNPSAYNTDWASDLDDQTGVVTITYTDGSTATFTLSNYDPSSRYLFAYYNETQGRQDGDTTTGSTVEVAEGDNFPDMTKWSYVGTTTTDQTATLTTIVKTDVSYSDGRDGSSNTTTSDESVPYQDIDAQYQQEVYKGSFQFLDYIKLYSDLTTEHQMTVGKVVTNEPTTTTSTKTLEDGTVETTTVTTTTQSIVYDRSYRDDVQEITTKSWGGLKVFIYKENSGNSVLDAMFAASTDYGSYMPFIPIRVWGEFVGEDHYSDIYPLAVKAMKRSCNGDFDKVSSQVADNKNIADINFCYTVFGVALNTVENAARLYLYSFFYELAQNIKANEDTINDWASQLDAANASIVAWGKWYDAQSDILNPLYGTPEPTKLTVPDLADMNVSITSGSNSSMNFNFVISFAAMAVNNGSGLAKEGAKKNDVWITTDSNTAYSSYLFDKGILKGDDIYVSKITIYKQTSLNQWDSVTIWGLKHTNMIYGGKAVITQATDALADSSESGFIIPINTAIMKATSLTTVTQMSTACAYLVFNCYKIKKIPWYETGFFKIFIMIIAIIVIAVVTVLTMGAGAVLGAGLLGTGFAVGTAIGLTGFMAAVVTAAVNALAVMLISKIVVKVATLAFGKQIGAIIGAVAGVIATVAGAGGFSNISDLFGQLADPITLGNLATTLTKDVAGTILQNKMNDIQNKMIALQTDYTDEMDKISTAYLDNLGDDQGVDTVALNNITNSSTPYYETSETFLSRTLLTGSDLVQISKNYVNNFTDLTIQTDLA